MWTKEEGCLSGQPSLCWGRVVLSRFDALAQGVEILDTADLG